MLCSSAVVVVIHLVLSCEKPTSRVAVVAHEQYELTVKQANDARREALVSAEDVLSKDLASATAEFAKKFEATKERSLKTLAAELDAALAAKDLKKANEIDTALQQLSDTTTPVALPAADATNLLKAYESVVRAADARHAESVKHADAEYLKQLEMALDTAFTSKDLREANRIDEEVKAIQRESALRATDKRLIAPQQLYVEPWASDLGSLSGVAVGPGEMFGANPFVYQIPDGAILRVNRRGVMEKFAVGFPPSRHGKIAFASGPAAKSFNGDMFVSAPQIEGGQDQIFRVNADGSVKLFFSTSQLRLTKGIAFGADRLSRQRLYTINSSGDSVLSIDPSGKTARLNAKVLSHFIDDDLVSTADDAFGSNIYVTDQDRGELIQVRLDSPARSFAKIPGAMSITRGEGAFGDFLYVGTSNGSVFRVSASGETSLFLESAGTPADSDIRGIDIQNDQMWLSTDSGAVLRVTFWP